MAQKANLTPVDKYESDRREAAPRRKAVISRSRGELARASANPACYDCNPILVSSGDVSTDCEPRLVKHAFGF
jgi:hypothetical protein